MRTRDFSFSLALVSAAPASADDAVRTGVGGVRRLAHGCAGRAPPDHAGRPAAALCDALDSEHVAARSTDRRRRSKGAAGFAVDLFASGLNMPRVIRVAPNGDIFVAETGAGTRARLSPGRALAPGRRKARSSPTACSGLMGLLSTRRGRIRASSMSRRRTLVVRFPYRSGDMKASGPAEKIASLPSGGATLDARPRFLARRQDAVRFGRVRQQ